MKWKLLRSMVTWSLCALVFSAAAGWKVAQRKERRWFAYWHESYSTPEEMAARADMIAVVEALDVKPGRIVTARRGPGKLPFEVVSFRVVEALKGARVGETVRIERIGGRGPDDEPVNLDADGGEFHRSQSYLMFLRKQKTGPYYYQINAQARFDIVGGHLWAASPRDKVARRFHGRSFSDGLAAIRGMLPRAHEN